MDQKSWPAPAADAPKPLIYKAEKDWKKDWGLNPPVFPLAGLMLLIRFHPVRPVERPPGAPPPTMCTPRGCVCVCVCVRAPVRRAWVCVGVRVVVPRVA